MPSLSSCRFCCHGSHLALTGRRVLRQDPRIPALRRSLLKDVIPNELRARLPDALGLAQEVSKVEYLAYDALIHNLRIDF